MSASPKVTGRGTRRSPRSAKSPRSARTSHPLRPSLLPPVRRSTGAESGKFISPSFIGNTASGSYRRPSSMNTAKSRNRKKSGLTLPPQTMTRKYRGIAVALLCGIAIAFIHQSYPNLFQIKALQIKHIEVTGNSTIGAKQLLSLAAVSPGVSILAIDLAAIALRLKSHPWVSEARVQRRFPNGVQIHIKEEVAVAIVSIGDLYLANKNGELFTLLRQGAPYENLPMITGFLSKEIADKPKESAANLKDGLTLYTAVTGSGLGKIQELHWDAVLGWSMVSIKDSGKPTLIHLGRAGASALDRASRLFATVIALGHEPRTIWADNDVHLSRFQTSIW